MKRRILLSIVLVVSLVSVSLMSSDSRVEAQNQLRVVADTGVITLGPNQALRVTVAAGDVNGDDPLRVRFRQMKYTQGVCSGGICKHSVESQTTSAPVTLAPNESAVVNAANYVVWRIVVFGSNRNLRATGAIVNVNTGEVTSNIIVANTEGDIH